MSSSHRSEPMHIQVLEQIESKIGLGEECLYLRTELPTQ